MAEGTIRNKIRAYITLSCGVWEPIRSAINANCFIITIYTAWKNCFTAVALIVHFIVASQTLRTPQSFTVRAIAYQTAINALEIVQIKLIADTSCTIVES